MLHALCHFGMGGGVIGWNSERLVSSASSTESGSRWRARDPGLIQGIGDDVAVVDLGSKALLVTTDILIEGIHFDRSWIDPYRLGKKALDRQPQRHCCNGGNPEIFPHLPRSSEKSSPLFHLLVLPWLKRRGKAVSCRSDRRRYFPFSKNRHQHLPFGRREKGKSSFQKRSKNRRRSFRLRDVGRCCSGAENSPKEGIQGRPRGLIGKHLSPCPGSNWARPLQTIVWRRP